MDEDPPPKYPGEPLPSQQGALHENETEQKAEKDEDKNKVITRQDQVKSSANAINNPDMSSFTPITTPHHPVHNNNFCCCCFCDGGHHDHSSSRGSGCCCSDADNDGDCDCCCEDCGDCDCNCDGGGDCCDC